MRRVRGAELLRRAEGVRRAYADAFGSGSGIGSESGSRSGSGFDSELPTRSGFGPRPQDEDGGVVGCRDAARYPDRLAGDVTRPGFVAALALDGDEVLGFATGWTTPFPFPSDRCHPQVAACLGAARTAAWLCGGREIDELAVIGAARGRGIGAALLDAVTADAPDGRCWLLTPVRAEAASAFYRHLGWTQVTHPAPGGSGHAAFLGPRHPAGAAARLFSDPFTP
ncbi:GNAT family N-acetyltransferase [Streptomyces sp. PTD5-9]|uniref:GNAT family N-acetyltransferase n=1 Tax=Streptomyces sp. PTD5-9 TaxID=3120150 RepID=UPI003007F939